MKAILSLIAFGGVSIFVLAVGVVVGLSIQSAPLPPKQPVHHFSEHNAETLENEVRVAQMAQDWLQSEVDRLTKELEQEKSKSAALATRDEITRPGKEYQSEVGASATRARAAYPDSYVDGTPLYSGVAKEVQRLKRVNPETFNDPEWVEAVVAKVATRMGIKAAVPAR